MTLSRMIGIVLLATLAHGCAVTGGAGGGVGGAGAEGGAGAVVGGVTAGMTFGGFFGALGDLFKRSASIATPVPQPSLPVAIARPVPPPYPPAAMAPSVPAPAAPVVIAKPPSGNLYPLWYATNRKPIAAADESKGYSNSYDNQVHYGKVFVEIPDDYLQSLRKPNWKELFFGSQDTRLVVRNIHGMSSRDFLSDLKDEVSKQPTDEQVVLVYLHGFNTKFNEAAQRAAAIGYETKIPFTAFFSWPSKGSDSPVAYRADLRSIEASEEEIAQFLLKIVRVSGAKRVHIIAHSMGNYGLLRALMRPVFQTAIRNKVRFGHVILAAPDVDTRLFERDYGQLKKIAEHVTLYASTSDAALKLSAKYADYSVVGLIKPLPIYDNIYTIDVTKVDLTWLGHAYVASAIDVLKDMYILMWDNRLPPDRRPGVSKQIDAGGTYWVLQ